jgi:phosphoenolpyruvate carboxykinase (GTP)
MRVLKWIVDRVRGRALAKETPLGWQPHYEDMDWEGLKFPSTAFEEIQCVDEEAWRKEVIGHEELLSSFTTTCPRS